MTIIDEKIESHGEHDPGSHFTHKPEVPCESQKGGLTRPLGKAMLESARHSHPRLEAASEQIYQALKKGNQVPFGD